MAGETLPTGSTNTQGLADWAAPYITDYLGKAKALSETPYQVYQGPLTAGASNLQNKVFSGLAGLTFPSNLGKSFASPMGQPQQPPVFNPATMIGGPGAMPPGGSDLYSPQVMPQQGPRGFNQGPKTEADWKMHSAMTLYAPGTDMEKAKADFLAGGQGGGPVSAGPGAMPPGGDYTSGTGATAPPPGAAPGSPEFMSWLSSQKGTGVQQGMRPQTLPSSAPSMPHQDYGSPQGIAGLTAPQTSQQPSSIAQSYMNPYLESVLAPQMEEMRRQSKLNLQPGLAKLTQAGGFGGGRQAIMESEAARNLLSEQNKTVGQGYSSAYDKAMAQFNAEQGQAKDLANLMSTQGGIERGIESEGIAADKEEFEKQRQYPFQQVQFQRDMISGLPTGSVQNTAGQLSGVGSLLSALGGGAAAAKAFGYKDVTELLKGLGLSTGS